MIGEIFEVSYPPSSAEGELSIGVIHRLWIPNGVDTLRGIIVHQHGCGEGACRGGETAADDLHWQALARKWDCALLGPAYRQSEDQECRLWCDPRNGSNETFLRALRHFAGETKHPELETIPWCLWGHSGGGAWASIMTALHTDRVVAAWLRSGTALGKESPSTPPAITDAIYGVPIVLNPGVEERDHERFARAWSSSLDMFEEFRAKGAPIAFAPDPNTGHQCGDSRYLAIPFFDACLRFRLPPDPGSPDLVPVDRSTGWRAELHSVTASPVESFEGADLESNWLPDKRVAEAWMEYVATGAVGDATPPPPAQNLRIHEHTGGQARLTWSAEADFESGIRAFVILRNGERLAQVPEEPVGKFGRPLFQSMSFHDTPEQPLPEMSWIDPEPVPDAQYQVVVINGVGLESDPSGPAVAG